MLFVFTIVGFIVFLFIGLNGNDSTKKKEEANEHIGNSASSLSNENNSEVDKSQLDSITDTGNTSTPENTLLLDIIKFFNEDGFRVSNNESIVTIAYDYEGYNSYVEIDITNGLTSDIKSTYVQLNKGSKDIIYKRKFSYEDTSMSDIANFNVTNYLKAIRDILIDNYSGFNHDGD